MGTRHLICVQLGGEYKIAQYGQWDGYPSGQGRNIIEFMKSKRNVKKLRDNLCKVRFLDSEGADKGMIDSYNSNAPHWSNDPDKRTPEQKRWFSTYICRDLGADILSNVANSDDDEIILRNSIEFSADSLSCEYAYVIDLDENKLEVYKGRNKSNLPVGHRFEKYTKELSQHEFDGETYKHIRKVIDYSLDKLPTYKQMENDVDHQEDE